MSKSDDEDLDIRNIMEMEVWHKLEYSLPILSTGNNRTPSPVNLTTIPRGLLRRPWPPAPCIQD